MADETRRQRRDARRAAGEKAVERAARRRPPAGRGRRRPGRARRARARAAAASSRESIAELRKVDWPNRAQTIQGTVVVIIAVLVVGAYLWGIDQIIRPFVRNVLLGQ